MLIAQGLVEPELNDKVTGLFILETFKAEPRCCFFLPAKAAPLVHYCCTTVRAVNTVARAPSGVIMLSSWAQSNKGCHGSTHEHLPVIREPQFNGDHPAFGSRVESNLTSALSQG